MAKKKAAKQKIFRIEITEVENGWVVEYYQDADWAYPSKRYIADMFEEALDIAQTLKDGR